MSKTLNLFSCQSPLQEDFDRHVNIDENGNEYITYTKVDYPSIQKSHGSFKDWSLNALLAAGIDPAISIHTGAPTRLDGLQELSNISSDVDAYFAENNNN